MNSELHRAVPANTLRQASLSILLAALVLAAGAGQLFAQAPAAPTGLMAIPASASVSLTWSASSGASGYHVKRATANGGPYTQIAAPTVASYTDNGLNNGTPYYYVVTAVDTAGESANSWQAMATPSAGPFYSLPANRGAVWNPGLMSKGGVPSANWPVCTAIATPLTPLGNNQDDTAQINAAIQACPVGSVVTLGTGTFLIDPEDKGNNFVLINKGVVLRGQGAGKTILNNPNNIPTTPTNNVNGNPTDPYALIIVGPGEWVNPDGDARCMGPTAYQTNYMQLLSANGVQGSYSVTVANGSIFRAGQFVLLDQTSGASWQTDVTGNETSVWASPNYAVQWEVHNPAPASGDDPVQTGVTPGTANNFAGSGNGADAACWFSRQDRPQNEMKEIASVSGNTVTFTSPLTMNYATSQHAELTTYTGGNLPVTYAGVENMTLVGGGNGAVEFTNTAYSWAKNIEVTNWYEGGVSILNSFRDELRDSYIHDAGFAEPGGEGYAINLQSGASEILVENNISVKANKVMVVRSSGAGSVVGYNYMDDGYIATDENFIEIGLNASHMVGSHHMLFEGNQSFNMDSDDTHGNSTYITYFRNYATTTRNAFTSDYTGDTINDAAGTIAGASASIGPKRAAGAMTYSYWMNYVGNVLGVPGVTTAANGYVDDETATAGELHNEIWLMGWNDWGSYKADPNVAATAIRDGNWDWYLGQQTWLTTPSAAGTIPNSLYLPGPPAFFGFDTWPWVDPTTGTTYTLPAKTRYDALMGAPSIATQPQSQTVTVGQTATFGVAASGTAPLSYQWKKNNTVIANATSSSYTTPATAAGDNGASFTVTVTNTAGNTTSSAATLTVNPAPQTIAFTNPGTQKVGTPLTLSATASSGLTVSFTSTTPGVCAVSGGTAAFVATGTCTIQATQTGNSTYAAATPLPQSFTVNANAAGPLTITTTACPGGTQGAAYAGCTIAVTGGTAPYQFSLDASGNYPPLPEGLTLNASTGAISSLQIGGQGTYMPDIIVKDAAGTQATAQIAFAISGSNAFAANIFPAGSIFHHRVDAATTGLPVDSSPAGPIYSAYLTEHIRVFFGNTSGAPFPNGIPMFQVPYNQPNVAVSTTVYQSYYTSGPIPANAPVEGTSAAIPSGGDMHVLIYRQAGGGNPPALYEMWQGIYQGGPWTDSSNALWTDVTSTAMTPQGGGTTDAAGLPVAPLVVNADEVIGTGTPAAPNGVVQHPIRFTLNHMLNYWVWPATQTAGTGSCSSGGNSIPTESEISQATPPTSCTMSGAAGEIYRLKASVASPACAATSPQANIIITGFRNYGIILADNGMSGGLIGTPDARWNDNDLSCLANISLGSFEPVNVSSLMVSDDSAATKSPQTIAFANPGAQTAGKPLTLSATASSGLAVSFASTTTGVCTVTGTTAAFAAPGTCTIQATQPGNGAYLAATPVPQSFTVNSASQSAPTGLAATAGNNSVSLTWTGVSGATSYSVYRGATSGGESTTALATGIATAHYTDNTAANGSKYYYEVAAVNGGGTSGMSNEASATPEPPAPSAPTGLTATPGNNSVSLTWTGASGATSYSVYRGATSGGESTTALATGIATAHYTDNTAANGMKYYYEVAAVNGGGTSGMSNEASATPEPPAPASIAATAGGGQSAQVNTAFPSALQATVKDSGNNPVAGATVTFTAPASGASGAFGSLSSATATTNTQGVATAPAFTANGITGSYSVTAGVSGVASTASFALTNAASGSTTQAGNAPATYSPSVQSVNLTATITSNSAPVTGGTVTFTVAVLGSATATVSGGQATASLQIPAGSQAGAYSISASYSGSGSVAASTGGATLSIDKANPALTWSNPADMIFGGALGLGQLNATANVPGSFVYTPPVGTVPPIGTDSLQVTFTPTDTTDYNAAVKTVTVNVTQTSPPGGPNLIATNLLARDPATNDVIVYVTVANSGSSPANNVQVTKVAIGTTAAVTPLPVSLGTIAPGGSAKAKVQLAGPVGASGTRAVLTVIGTCTGGQFTSGGRVILP